MERRNQEPLTPEERLDRGRYKRGCCDSERGGSRLNRNFRSQRRRAEKKKSLFIFGIEEKKGILGDFKKGVFIFFWGFGA